MPSLATLSLGWVPVRSPALIDLNFQMITLVDIAGKEKELTCT
jgi:hypothetical protein